MKTERLNLYTIDMKYIRNLAQVDKHVFSVSPQENKANRPFVGIIVVLEQKKYCIPLTSPKPKHETMKNDVDFSKIFDKNGRLIGALNFNNMLPINESVIKRIVLTPKKNDTPKDKIYKELLNNQLDWCNDNIDNIVKKANKLYNVITNTPEKSYALTRRCCDFKKLEEVLQRFTENAAAKSSNQKTEKLIKEVTNEEYSALSKSGIKFAVQKKNGKTAILFDKSLKDKINQVIENVHKKGNRRK